MLRKEQLDLSIYKLDLMDDSRTHIYEGISTFEEAHLLSVYAMNHKKPEEIIMILPGWNLTLDNNDIMKATELDKKYKIEKRDEK